MRTVRRCLFFVTLFPNGEKHVEENFSSKESSWPRLGRVYHYHRLCCFDCSCLCVDLWAQVADQYAIGAGMLPGAHAEDNAPIVTSEYAGFTQDADGNNVANGEVTWGAITGNATLGEMDNNVVTAASNSADAFVAE